MLILQPSASVHHHSRPRKQPPPHLILHLMAHLHNLEENVEEVPTLAST